MLSGSFAGMYGNAVDELLNMRKFRFIKAVVLFLLVSFAKDIYNNYIHDTMNKLL